jgi:hypothetical protein
MKKGWNIVVLAVLSVLVLSVQALAARGGPGRGRGPGRMLSGGVGDESRFGMRAESTQPDRSWMGRGAYCPFGWGPDIGGRGRQGRGMDSLGQGFQSRGLGSFGPGFGRRDTLTQRGPMMGRGGQGYRPGRGGGGFRRGGRGMSMQSSGMMGRWERRPQTGGMGRLGPGMPPPVVEKPGSPISRRGMGRTQAFQGGGKRFRIRDPEQGPAETRISRPFLGRGGIGQRQRPRDEDIRAFRGNMRERDRRWR